MDLFSPTHTGDNLHAASSPLAIRVPTGLASCLAANCSGPRQSRDAAEWQSYTWLPDVSPPSIKVLLRVPAAATLWTLISRQNGNNVVEVPVLDWGGQ
eukprot:g35932.t1